MDMETEGNEVNDGNNKKAHQAPAPSPVRRSGTDVAQRHSNTDLRRSLSVSHDFHLRRVLPASTSGRDARLKSLHQNVHRSRLYKVMVVGEVNTGKSALVRRYVHNFFSDRGSYRATLGVDFQLKLINLNDEIEIRLQLWDIAGQERFCNMTRAYYKGAVGAFLVCDASNVKTLDALVKWKKDLDSKCKTPNGRPIPCILILNKTDLAPDPKFPDPDGVTKFVRDIGCVLPWYGASAKTGQGVQEAMNRMVRQVMAVDTWSYPRFSESETETDTDSSVFSDRTDTPIKGLSPGRGATLRSTRDFRVREDPHCGC